MNIVRKRLNAGLTKRQAAHAQRQINRALSAAQTPSIIPKRTTMARVLSHNPLTVGIIKETPDDLSAHLRQLVLARIKGAEQIGQVETMFGRGERPRRAALQAAQDLLYSLSYDQWAKLPINHARMEVLGLSYSRLAAKAFPLLELVPMGFCPMDWSTEANGIRNVRYQLFRRNPGFREIVEAIEAFLDDPSAIEPPAGDLNFINFIIRRTTTLTTKLGLQRNGLGAYKHYDYFGSTPVVRSKCFPFTNHPAAALPAGPFTPESSPLLNGLFEAFKANYRLDWETSRSCKNKLTDADLFARYSALVLYREESVKSFRDELLRLKRSVPVLNEGNIMLNSAWVRRFGPHIFEDLFGLSLKSYIRSARFREEK